MRIVSGRLRGRRISTTILNGTRPTTDLVRESIFNILSHRIELEGASVLDLFAGSGALGFEAWSRGARFVTFVENNSRVASSIRTSALGLGIPEEEFEVWKCESKKFLYDCSHQFDCVVCDPPYLKGLAKETLQILAAEKIVSDGGIVVMETSSREILTIPENFSLITDRVFGEAKVWILECVHGNLSE